MLAINNEKGDRRNKKKLWNWLQVTTSQITMDTSDWSKNKKRAK